MGDLATFDIGISVDESVPHGVVDDLFLSSKLDVQTERRPSTAYAVVRWLAPTLVILFLSRKLFDSFLAEAGKDLYVLVKRSLVTLADRTSGERALVRPVVIATHGKVSEGWHAPIMSTIIPLNDGRRAVFLFMPAVSTHLHEQAVSAMLDFARRHASEGLPLSSAGISLDDSIGRWGSIPLIYDETCGWRAVTSRD